MHTSCVTAMCFPHDDHPSRSIFGILFGGVEGWGGVVRELDYHAVALLSLTAVCTNFAVSTPVLLYYTIQVEDELYIVMELLESDLHRIIQSPQASSLFIISLDIVSAPRKIDGRFRSMINLLGDD